MKLRQCSLAFILLVWAPQQVELGTLQRIDITRPLVVVGLPRSCCHPRCPASREKTQLHAMAFRVVSTGCMLSHDRESKRPNVCVWRKGPGCLGCCWFPPVCSPSGRPCLGFLASQTTWDCLPVSPCQANVPEQGA